MISCICFPSTKRERDKQISGSSSPANLANQWVPGNEDRLSRNVKVERNRGKHSRFMSSSSLMHIHEHIHLHTEAWGKRILPTSWDTKCTRVMGWIWHILTGSCYEYLVACWWVVLTLETLETWWDRALLEEVVTESTFMKVFPGCKNLPHSLLPVS